ncbi:uncharacterized protein LOC107793162 [Nicotiana tabacum]|uniref:Uncharacterized protein LOC107793162 n=2 Tax=Nicotiana TaxID=4085 RepID=A0A1S4A2M0_TOBAC|nr:PREDICTED: uncharacterized protein LOC104234505 [Nicotiana sylvestris]XP_016470932.1 PREDICTED: uncharacterized protein LOC107793162 [Nicotiana tabacum]
MAKISVAVLFLLFTLSFARIPVSQPENDVMHLKLPSENDVIRPEHLNTLQEFEDSAPILSLPKNADNEETHSVHTLPLTLVKFRLRSNLPFRLCRHHFHHRDPVSRRQIPYGNDKILSSGKNIDFDKFAYRVGVRELPSDRVNFHHYHHDNEDDDHKEEKISKFLDKREKLGKISKFLDDDRVKFGKKKLKRQNQFQAHRFDKDDDIEDDKRSKLDAKYYGEDQFSFDRMKLRKHFHYRDAAEEEEEEKAKWHKRGKKKGGFMRSIRKFLHHYFD